MCIFGCHGDEDCSASESCRNNKCINPCSESPCGPNAHCTVSNHRATCSCGAGFVPNPTAKIACVREPPPPCKENRECPSGNVCIENSCRTLCSSDLGCLSNERCESATGVCKNLCRKDDDCSNGEVCEGLVCARGCRTNAGCPADKSCVNNKCVDMCDSPTSCGTNAECKIVNHQKKCDCPEPLVGDPVVGCKYPIVPCYEDGECTNGRVCYGGFCEGMCRTDRNCLADERCIQGVCKSVCNSDASCPANQICENRLCQSGCRSDSVCEQHEACINNKCQSM